MAWTLGTVLDSFDTILNTGVATAYTASIGTNTGFVSAAALLSFIILSWRLLSPRGTITMMDYVHYMIVIILVYGVALSWSLVSTYVYPLFAVWPGSVAGGIAQDISGYTMTSPNDAFHVLFTKAIAVTFQIWGLESGLSAIPYYLLGTVILLVFGLMLVVALGFLLMAKVVIAMAFALGPLFVALLFFESTRSIFKGWLSVLATNAILVLLVYMAAALFVGVFDSYAVQISPSMPLQQQLESAMAYALFTGIMFFVTKHLMIVAQSIGGAFGLPRFMQGVADSAIASGYRGLGRRFRSWRERRRSRSTRDQGTVQEG